MKAIIANWEEGCEFSVSTCIYVHMYLYGGASLGRRRRMRPMIQCLTSGIVTSAFGRQT